MTTDLSIFFFLFIISSLEALLARAGDLQKINLSEIAITDAILDRLVLLPKLQNLDLSGTVSSESNF